MEGEAKPSPGSSTSASHATPQAPPTEPLPVNYDVFEVETDRKVEPYLVSVDISGATHQMEIETGSAVTLVSEATFSKLWPPGKPPRLENTPIRLRTYSGEELRVVVVRVRCGGKEEVELGLVVVDGKGPSLLGRDWLDRFGCSMRCPTDSMLCSLSTVISSETNLAP